MTEKRLQELEQLLESRIPLLGGWLRHQALKELSQDASPAAVGILTQAIMQRPDIHTAALKILRRLAEQGNQDAQEALCRLVIECDHAGARDVVMTKQYAPHDTEQRALFFFLTEQWEHYECVDVDRKLLMNLYPHIDFPVRIRLAKCAEKAGRLDYVNLVLRECQTSTHQNMTDEEWDITVQTLSQHHAWQTMWDVAQAAPPIGSVRLLKHLKHTAWKPEQEVEREAYDTLIGLAEVCSEGESQASGGVFTNPKRLHRRFGTEEWPEGESPTFAGKGKIEDVARYYTAEWSEDESPVFAEERKIEHILRYYCGSVACLAISKDGTLLITGGEGRAIRVWHLPDGEEMAILFGHVERVSCLALSPDGRLLVSGTSAKTIHLYHLPDGTEGRSLMSSALEPKMYSWYILGITGLAISPDGRLLVSGSRDKDEQTLCLWSLPDGKALKTLKGHTGGVTDVAISPDGRILASGSEYGNIRLWSLPEGNALQTFKGHQWGVNKLVFSPDGRLLASGGRDKTPRVRVWDVSAAYTLQQNSKVNSVMSGRHTSRVGQVTFNSVEHVAFSPDGRLLASASGLELRLWSLSDRKAIKTLEGHTAGISCVAFSPDRRLLASGCNDCMIRLWSVPDGKAIHTLQAGSGHVECLAFSPDGRLMISGSKRSDKDGGGRPQWYKLKNKFLEIFRESNY